MENNNNKAFSRPFLLTLCVLCFALFVVIVPTTYAQTPSYTAAKKEAKNQQYTEVIHSVYNFVLEYYVDEIDPLVLYQGALKGLQDAIGDPDATYDDYDVDEVDPLLLYESILTEMLDAIGDPYTIYMDSTLLRDLTDTTVGNFGGIGVTITKPVESTDENPAFVEVGYPIEDTPGWKAGIQSGDYIITIDGIYTPDITMDEVLKILRGEVGDPVDLTIRRGKTGEFDVTLIRALIEVPTVKYGMITEGGHKTGYVDIAEFTPQTPDRVQDALDSFEEENFDSLIIDLRNNPGGLITSVVDVADKFIENGVIVSTKGRHNFESTVFRATRRETTMPEDIPIVVLINGGSASASEILAGALKDYHLAYLVGDRTYGKGSVQQVVPLPNGDGIKLTTSRYYTPSDSNIDKIGIPPDLEILYPEYSEEEDELYVELMTSTVISHYVEEHPNMTEEEIAIFAQELGKTYNLNQSLLRRIIRIEATRMLPVALYDLDFDIQLVKALELFNHPDFDSLVESAKTLSELQAIATEENAKATEKKAKEDRDSEKND